MSIAINPPIQPYEGVLPNNIQFSDSFSLSRIDFPWEVGARIWMVKLGQITPRLNAVTIPHESVEVEFRRLANQWSGETAYDSSLARKITHPAYQRIMAMGKEALPLIFAELRDNPNHWFYALQMIVGRDIAEGTHNFDDAKAAWLFWGYQENYI